MYFNDYVWRGIDTSQFNGKIDLSKFKESGGKFVIPRCSFGQVTDYKFVDVDQQCIDLELDQAIYHYEDYYSHFGLGLTSTQWGKRQAEKIDSLNKRGLNVFIDVENASTALAASVTKKWSTVITILDNILYYTDNYTGKTTGIYASLGLLNQFYAYQKSRPLFVALYNKTITIDQLRKKVADTGWSNLLLWQYASDGDVDDDGIGDGIRLGMQYKNLDLDIWLSSDAAYEEYFGRTITSTTENLWAEMNTEEKLELLKSLHPEIR